MAVSQSNIAQTDGEKKLLSLCNKDNTGDIIEQLKETLKEAGVRVDATDEDGMTSLMHAAYGGKLELCRVLLENGADVNSTLHSQGYTALMFATIAGHAQVVDLLMRSGARPDIVNGINRTAAQMGGFVGQHECVQIINNFFSIDELDYYTKPQGLETVPKLDHSLVVPLHEYISTPNIHPVRLLLMLQSNCNDLVLVESHSQVCKVLGILCDKTIKDEKEPFSLKLYYLSYTIKETWKADSIEVLLKRLLIQNENGKSLEVEKFMRQCLKEYPHVHSVLLKQLVSSLANVPISGHPSALSLFTSAINGNRHFVEQDICSTCGISSDHLKKCSKCKRVWYCGTECQTLAWTMGNHKKLCKKWTKDLSTSLEQPSEPTTSEQ